MKFSVRLIPPAVAVFFGLATISPLATGWPGEITTNKATLLLIAIMFAVKTCVFGWMRLRLTDGRIPRHLTRFGETLADFFTAVTLCDFTITLLFAVSYWYAHHGMLTPYPVRVSDRAAIAAGAALTIATGIFVGLEIRRAGFHRLRVHDNDYED